MPAASSSTREGDVGGSSSNCTNRDPPHRVPRFNLAIGAHLLLRQRLRLIRRVGLVVQIQEPRPAALELALPSDSNPEFRHELEQCHSKLGGWPTDADFDFVYTFSYDTGSDRLVGFSCRHEGVTPFIPADAYDNCNKHDDC